MASILVELKTDAETALKWLGNEAHNGLVAVEELAMPLIQAAEPTIISDVKAGVVAGLTTLATSAPTTPLGALEDIEQALLEMWETTAPALFTAASGLKGSILQAIIALVRAAA